MLVKTVLHRVHKVKGFVYEKARFHGDRIEVEIRPRKGSRPIWSGCGRRSPGYDAWNRLVKVQSSLDSGAVTIQTAEFDAMGCRIKKVVTNAGEYDGTVVYFYEGQKILEMRDGSGNMVQQFIHGTRYIDELVMVRVKNKGEFYVH